MPTAPQRDETIRTVCAALLLSKGPLQAEVKRAVSARARLARAAALAAPAAGTDPAVGLEDFVAYMPMHRTSTSRVAICGRPRAWTPGFRRCRFPAGRARLASAWLDGNQPVEQMTWAPGEPS